MALWMAAVSSLWPSPFAPNALTDVPVHTASATVAEPAQRVEKRTIASVVFTVILLSRALPLPRVRGVYDGWMAHRNSANLLPGTCGKNARPTPCKQRRGPSFAV